MTASIFYKSWKADLGWLNYSLHFLERNWTEPDTEVVVMLDGDCSWDFEPKDYELNLKVCLREPWPDGYSHAMFVKCYADIYCQSDLILLMDSDAMLIEEANLASFMEGGLPFICWTPYDEHLAQYPFSPWKRIVQNLMKVEPERHYMTRLPILYWASTFRGLRRFLCEKNPQAANFEELVYSREPFLPVNFSTHNITINDYDLLGQFAALEQPELYRFIPEEQAPPRPVRQFHSWTQWQDGEIRLTLDQLLLKVSAAG